MALVLLPFGRRGGPAVKMNLSVWAFGSTMQVITREPRFDKPCHARHQIVTVLVHCRAEKFRCSAPIGKERKLPSYVCDDRWVGVGDQYRLVRASLDQCPPHGVDER
jgi:hypothetical protein